jgi:hypothetical protein
MLHMHALLHTFSTGSIQSSISAHSPRTGFPSTHFALYAVRAPLATLPLMLSCLCAPCAIYVRKVVLSNVASVFRAASVGGFEDYIHERVG